MFIASIPSFSEWQGKGLESFTCSFIHKKYSLCSSFEFIDVILFEVEVSVILNFAVKQVTKSQVLILKLMDTQSLYRNVFALQSSFFTY